jgi:Rieske Fe-S protein
MSSPTDIDTEAGEAGESGPDRRSLIKAAALVAVPVAGVGTVAACSSSNSKTDASSDSNGNGASGGSAASGGGNTPVQVATSDVPVGGGKVVQSASVVVCQPSAGVYKAYSAVCTHQGCLVARVADNQITCPCHGSVFSATDGSVVNGPAKTALGAMTAKVDGANIQVTGAAS